MCNVQERVIWLTSNAQIKQGQQLFIVFGAQPETLAAAQPTPPFSLYQLYINICMKNRYFSDLRMTPLQKCHAKIWKVSILYTNGPWSEHHQQFSIMWLKNILKKGNIFIFRKDTLMVATEALHLPTICPRKRELSRWEKGSGVGRKLNSNLFIMTSLENVFHFHSEGANEQTMAPVLSFPLIGNKGLSHRKVYNDDALRVGDWEG